MRVAIRFGGSLEYFLNLPIAQFMGLLEDIIEADEEAKRVREQNRRRKR